jgi:predicted acyltransferase
MTKTDERILSLDLTRGLAIILMVIANYLAGIAWIPEWLKHAKDTGFTPIDAIAPLFIFLIGFTIVLSFKKKEQASGTGTAYLHAIRRFLALIGIGAIITAGEQLIYQGGTSIFGWGVLQAIGAAGLITLLVIGLNKYIRLVAGFVLCLAYQLLLDSLWTGAVLGSSHGGLLGSLSWGGMLIISTSLAEYMLGKNRKISMILLIGAIYVIAGIGLSFLFPLAKNRVSFPYVILTIGISTLVFAIFEIITAKTRLPLGFLRWWGKNPLFLYLLHYILLAFIVLPDVPFWYSEASIWLVGLQLAFLLGILSSVAWFLQKKGTIIRI